MGAGIAPTGAARNEIPADLQAAIDAEPKARAMLAKLSAQNRFALAFRTHKMKTEAPSRSTAIPMAAPSTCATPSRTATASIQRT